MIEFTIPVRPATKKKFGSDNQYKRAVTDVAVKTVFSV